MSADALGMNIESALQHWADCGAIRVLDHAFARFVQRESPQAGPLLVLAAALVSHQLARGHTCLDLQAVLADPDFALGITDPLNLGGQPTPSQLLACLRLEDWLHALRCEDVVQPGEGNTPLVLDGHRLYLRRYWNHEREVRMRLDRMLERTDAIRAGVDRPTLALLLDRLFGAGDPGGRTDWQRFACALAAGNAFTVITGGPGTGKTTTVVKLLAVLQALALSAGKGAPALAIRLAAPTGKAAARLSASIQRAMTALPLGEGEAAQQLRNAIPTGAVTLHRLLGSRPGTRRMRHDMSNPLPIDVLVIDEVSMVDLEMMAATLAALRPGARLILLGDKDQLASVEAGTVLGELCRRAPGGHYTKATVDWLVGTAGRPVEAGLQDPDGSPLDQAVAMLRHSHRFDAASGIGRLAKAVNEGDARAAQIVLHETRADVAVLDIASPGASVWRELVLHGLPGPAEPTDEATAEARADGYAHYLRVMREAAPGPGGDDAGRDAWARKVLQAMARFQVLCAVREGPWGVQGLNAQIAADLFRAGLIGPPLGWYAGRPVLVTKNDAGLGLMNGDVGVTLAIPAAAQDDASSLVLRVAFDDGEGGVRWIAPSRLSAVETVFALTVHKSQGSEYAHVILVLPESAGPILSRELLYTGITRASERITLAGRSVRAVAGRAMARAVLRSSGLVRAAPGVQPEGDPVSA